MLVWVAGTVVLLCLGAGLFIRIARKGRKLRTARTLPGEATRASLQSSDGKQYSINSREHFYIGSHAGNDVVLSGAPQEYSVCIFYHRRRFAFQTLSGSQGIRVNDEEIMAGYLANDDVLEIAGERFVFRCY